MLQAAQEVQKGQKESEEESGEVPGMPALFSVCTSTDAYSVVTVQVFLIQNQSLVASYSFCLLLIECMLRVAFDLSLRLRIEKDNLGQGQDQYGIAQTWCLGKTLPLSCSIFSRIVRQPAGGDSPVRALVTLHVRSQDRALLPEQLAYLSQGKLVARSIRRSFLFF